MHEATGVAEKAGKVLEDGFATMVQAPRHLAETVRHQVHNRSTVLCTMSDLSETPCMPFIAMPFT